MKTMNKFLIGLGVAGSLVLGLTAPADAQHSGHMTAFNSTAFHMRPDATAVHGGFYHPYVYPRVGVVVHMLPLGYYSFFWNSYPYFYCDGLFYQSYSEGSYKVTAPPVGAEVPSLPIGAEILTIDDNPYWVYKGIYYESVIHPGGQFAYRVVGKDGISNGAAEADPSLPLIGDMTDKLPDGSRQVKLSGKEYWVTPDEIYLEEFKKQDKLRYRVVWVPERKKMTAATGVENKG
jgi:hypothetical protein